MHNIDNDCTNWKDVESLFFNKVLKKTDPKASYKAKDLLNEHIPPEGEKLREGRGAIADYQEAIFNASRSMIRFKKPQHLIKMIDKIINEKVGVTHSAVLLYDTEKNSYILVDSKGAKGKKIPVGYVRLDPKSPVISLFSEKKNQFISESGAVDFKELKWILENGQLMTKDASFHNKLRLVLKEMELLRVPMTPKFMCVWDYREAREYIKQTSVRQVRKNRRRRS